MSTPRRHSRARRAAPRPAQEIIIRCGGRPIDLRPDDDGPVLSVAALLRREGRGPHAAAGVLKPRSHLRSIDQPAPAPPETRRPLRKITVTATALFAIGAVVGPSMLNDAALPRTERPDPGTIGGGSGPGYRIDPEAPLAAVFLPAALQTVNLADADAGAGAGSGSDRTPAAGGSAGGRVPTAAVPEPANPGLPDPGSPGTGTPGAPGPGPTTPTPPGPGGPGSGPGPGDPGSGPGPVTVPGVSTPPVTVPSIDLPVVPGVPVSTPGIAIGPGSVTPPSVSVAVPGDGVAVSSTPARIATPDVTTSETKAGPVTVGEVAVELPDVGLPAVSMKVVAEDPVGTGLLGGVTGGDDRS